MSSPIPGIQVRPARPDDVEAAVPLIYSSGPAAFDYVFFSGGKPAQDFLRAAFVQGDGEFGYRNHTVAVFEGQVVGIGAAFGSDRMLPFTLAAARQILSFYGVFHAAGPIRRGLQVEGVVQQPRGPMHYIAHLGVAPERRSRGIGAALIATFLDDGARLGRTTAALDVAATNPRAQALYERLGFVVTGTRRSTLRSEVAVVVDHHRMERAI
jgi:ribosomal protein S18 acetylase RimI-like enzyme